MAYFIKQIENNKYNHYKYHYLDHMTSVIDIRDNYWSFDIDLYSINDFSLPINSLAGDLQMPYQTVSDIAFNLNSDQSEAQSGVIYNKQYARLYSGHFDVDVSQNEYLKQDLNNTKIILSLSLFIDPEAAKGAGTDIKQEDLDPLINETSEQRWDYELYYTNTHLILQSANIDNIVGYSLPFGHECISKNRQVSISSPTLERLNNPFSELTTISSNIPFQVLSAKIKFLYWIEFDSVCKTLEATLNIDRAFNNDLVISFDEYTLYDFVKNEVTINSIGSKGFYIPKYSHGYYELELQIMQEHCTNKLIIRNNFDFMINEIQPYIIVTHKIINDLNGFKEVKFND